VSHLNALRIATAARAGIATVVPFYAAHTLGAPVLVWASLGGWLGSLADPGGAQRPRMAALAAFAFGGGLAVALGLAAASRPLLAACVLALVTFGATVARARIPAAASIGTVLAITIAIATSVVDGSPPLRAGLWFAIGAGWPVLLSSLVWGGPPAPRADPAPPVPPEAVLRHAVCVVAVALVAFAVGYLVSPGRVSWVTVSAVAVMQPFPSATATRAAERVLGTVLGCVVVIVIMRLVHAPLAIALLMLGLATAATLARPRSYRMFVAFLTPVFVLVAGRLYADWNSIALRVVDVMLGSLLAVAATFVEHRLRRR
jgi:hypothetical protein